jgi:cation diffusion facilitator family transporter
LFCIKINLHKLEIEFLKKELFSLLDTLKQRLNDKLQNETARQSYGIFCGAFGIICNLILFILKIIAGHLVSSVAIIADAFHDLSDMISSVVTIFAFKMANRPADKQHPFGHGRIEYVAGLFVSFLIVFMGLEFTRWSFERILAPKPVVFWDFTIIILILSVILKFFMAIIFKIVSERINSTAIRANFKESLSDMFATITVLISILISTVFGFSLDGFIGLLVSILIIHSGISMIKETLGPILGQAPSYQFVNQIKQKVLSHEQIKGIHDFILHSYGPQKTLISLHAEVDCNANLTAIHNIVDKVEREIKQEFCCEIVIHIDPVITDDVHVCEVFNKLKEIAKNVDSKITIHDFRMISDKDFIRNDGKNTVTLIFDVILPINLDEAPVLEKIRSDLKNTYNTYDTIINIDRDYGY